MDKLRFGTAGIPISTPNANTVNGIKHVRKLGLEGMELEFVRSVNISEEKTSEIRKVAEENAVELTCHAPYYVNLSSLEEKKIEESKQRILKAARIAWLCGAKSVTFHAGFYMKKDPEEVYQKIKQGLKEIVEILRKEGNQIKIRPETTGKESQWGSVDEILRMSKGVEGVLPCIDFSHVYARSIGKINSYNQFKEILEKVEKNLGRMGLEEMHIHVSGIEYGVKGERWHLTLDQCDFKYKELLKALKEFKCKGIVISESPNIEEDAKLMQKEYDKI